MELVNLPERLNPVEALLDMLRVKQTPAVQSGTNPRVPEP